MLISFSDIPIKSTWTRQALANHWGYESFHAFARGVFTPRNQKLVILFVSEQKPEGFTPYEDGLQDRRLTWEGEKGHGSDKRIADAGKAGDEIHVFYRKAHRDPFTYLGKATVDRYELHAERPSRFEFVIQ